MQNVISSSCTSHSLLKLMLCFLNNNLFSNICNWMQHLNGSLYGYKLFFLSILDILFYCLFIAVDAILSGFFVLFITSLFLAFGNFSKYVLSFVILLLLVLARGSWILIVIKSRKLLLLYHAESQLYSLQCLFLNYSYSNADFLTPVSTSACFSFTLQFSLCYFQGRVLRQPTNSFTSFCLHITLFNSHNDF